MLRVAANNIDITHIGDPHRCVIRSVTAAKPIREGCHIPNSPQLGPTSQNPTQRPTSHNQLDSADGASPMAPSLRDHASSFIRPSTRDTRDRPSTRDHVEHSLVIPSRTSSLHSRITQPISSALNVKPNQRTPKTLTHAYMVCGVGREPSQWVKAPPPTQGKIGHMKGAVGQFWLPEILGSSPRLEQDNEVARALYAAMRVR